MMYYVSILCIPKYLLIHLDEVSLGKRIQEGKHILKTVIQIFLEKCLRQTVHPMFLPKKIFFFLKIVYKYLLPYVPT